MNIIGYSCQKPIENKLILSKNEVLIRGTKKIMRYEFFSIHIVNSTLQLITNRNKQYNIENPYYFTDLCWVICLKIVKI